MQTFFYSRVSTIGQNLNRQFENFKNLKEFDPQKLYYDKISGSIPFFQRPEASKLFDVLTSIDGINYLVVDSTDRLGRNLIDVLNTIEIFTKNKISLRSLKEGFQTLDENGKENPTAKIVLSVMASISEMEKNRIKERTSEGIAIAKAHGKFKGRKPGTTVSENDLLDKYPIAVKKLGKNLSIREVASITGNSINTVQKVRKILLKRRLI